MKVSNKEWACNAKFNWWQTKNPAVCMCIVNLELSIQGQLRDWINIWLDRSEQTIGSCVFCESSQQWSILVNGRSKWVHIYSPQSKISKKESSGYKDVFSQCNLQSRCRSIRGQDVDLNSLGKWLSALMAAVIAGHEDILRRHHKW